MKLINQDAPDTPHSRVSIQHSKTSDVSGAEDALAINRLQYALGD